MYFMIMNTRCCIVGGGPAGVMLGYLLARGGVPVIVLEKHPDFFRDFRGDTVHPSTLEVLDTLGLLHAFQRLPQRKVDHLSFQIAGKMQEVIDFRGLTPFSYLSFIPQWDFLNFLTENAKSFPQFKILMGHEVTGLLKEQGSVTGVRVQGPEGEMLIHADLVIGCDGRHSTVRTAAGLLAKDFGAPMDVLWFRLSRKQTHSEETFGIIGNGQMMILINRTDYWQAGFVIPKGFADAMRREPIERFRSSIINLAPFLADAVLEVRSWEDVKMLEVRVNRLLQWYQPGLLLIGDAAHAMSPIGGVGINLAIQDAVAAANILTQKLLLPGPIDTATLHAVQRRRMLPTKVTQMVQLQLQKRIISRVLTESNSPPKIPTMLRWLLQFRSVRHIPARLFGYGFRKERVQ